MPQTCVFRGARFRTSLLEWVWIESLSQILTAARKGLLRRQIFSDAGKLLNDSLKAHFLATRVELMSSSIRSVSFYDNRCNLGINNTLISMKTFNSVSVNASQRWLWRHGTCWPLSFVNVCPAHMARQFKILPLSEADGKIPSPPLRCHGA